MMITFCNREYSTKPNNNDIRFYLSKTANNSTMDLSVQEIAQNIGKGKTFRPNAFDLASDEYINGGLFLSTEFIVLDIDNDNRDVDYVSLESMKAKLLNLDIQPCIMYPTFSSTPTHNKFRVIFHLNETIHKGNQRKFDILIQMLLSVFPESDKNCKDRNRMFHGTRHTIDSFYINEAAVLNEVNLFQRFAEHIEQSNTNSTRQWQRIARQWGVELTQRGIPNILKNDERKTFQVNFVGGLESHPMSYNDHRGRDVPINAIQGDIPSVDVERQDSIEIRDWEERLLRISNMYKGFHDGTLVLNYNERMFLFQNLMFINGGFKRFKEILEQHSEKYTEHTFAYYLRQICSWRKTLNFPQSLDTFDYRSQYNDWLSQSGHTSILTALQKRTFTPEYIPDGTSRVSVESGFDLLKTQFDRVLSTDDYKIYGIRAGVGLGKTKLYVEYDYSQYKKVMIALPTHALAEEVERRMLDSSQMDFVRLLPKPNIEDATIKREYEKCLNSGLYYQARVIFYNYFAANPTQEYQEYIQAREKSKSSKIVITTHSYAAKTLDIRKYDLVIFDEDFLSEYISVSNLKYSDLIKFFRSCNIAGIAGISENILNQVKSTYDQRMEMDWQECKFSKCRRLIDVPQLDDRALRINQRYISELPDANVIDFIRASAYCIDAENSHMNGNNISFVTRKPFRYKCKVLVLSATMDKSCFNVFCNSIRKGSEKAEFIEIPELSNQGCVRQDLTYTFSETDLVEHFPDRISHIKETVSDWQNRPVLTFRKLISKFEHEGFQIATHDDKCLYYGNLTGIDSLKGKDLIIVGKFSPPEEYYRLVGEALHYDSSDSTITNRIVTVGEHKTKIYTYSPDSALANLYHYKISGELIQAVGRARTARTNANVHVFADFPLRISDVTTFDGGEIKST